MDGPEADRLYELNAIIVHIGGGPNSGHYIALAKSEGNWYMFDDEDVSLIDPLDLNLYFGETNLGTGYVLLYKAADFDHTQLLRSIMPDHWTRPQTPTLDTKQRVTAEDIANVFKKPEPVPESLDQESPTKSPKKEGKRPSLPLLSLPMDRDKKAQPKSAMVLDESKKEGGWGWFKNKKDK